MFATATIPMSVEPAQLMTSGVSLPCCKACNCLVIPSDRGKWLLSHVVCGTGSAWETSDLRFHEKRGSSEIT